MFDWMAWTAPVAVFFACIVAMLIGMTLWEIQLAHRRGGAARRSPPRGDRLIGLLGGLREPVVRRRQRS